MFAACMAQDDGGRRCNEAVALEAGMQPGEALSALGMSAFQEPLSRSTADFHASVDSRHERKQRGSIKYAKESRVPDVGGLGWRTRTGHLLKNQTYYSMKPRTNKWDLPAHAGVNSWKEWHGPKMKTDAETMERMDRWDEDQALWEAKKTFVNTTRVQTLDRFYNRKLHREELEHATSWAPHRHSLREVHGQYETFDTTLDEKPRKELKKVLTTKVLERDREAIRHITSRIQKEETWKMVWKQMEQERRSDIRADLQHRQAHNDRLMQLSGQKVKNRSFSEGSMSVTNASQRNSELAAHRVPPPPKDVTTMTDFRGLIHADNEHALEALFPGSGHELSNEFRARATASTEAGWPAPPKPETPRGRGMTAKEHSVRELDVKKTATLSKHSIPASQHRLENLGTRLNCDHHKDHAKAQFLPTRAPPAPDQNRTVLKEDWLPDTVVRDPMRRTGSLARTSPSFMASHLSSPEAKKAAAMEHLPPPTRPMVYPVMSISSPKASMMASRRSTHSPGVSWDMDSMAGSHLTNSGPTRQQSAPAFSLMSPVQTDASGMASPSSSFHRQQGHQGSSVVPTTTEVCKELDEFESRIPHRPAASNFFSEPQASGSGSAARNVDG